MAARQERSKGRNPKQGEWPSDKGASHDVKPNVVGRAGKLKVTRASKLSRSPRKK